MLTFPLLPNELWFKIFLFDVTNKEVSLVSSQLNKIFNNESLRLSRVEVLLASRGITVANNNLDSYKEIILSHFPNTNPSLITRYEKTPDLTLSRILLEEDANNLCLIADRIPLIRPQDDGFKECSKLQKRKMIIDLLNQHSQEIAKIDEIDLTSLQLTSIPSELTFFKGLKKINLSNNKIKTIPEDFSNSFHELEKLQIDFNPIYTLPTHFGKEWKNLKSLSLAGLKIKNLDANFGCYFTELEFLELSSGQLDTIPTGFGKGWSKILNLYLHRNKFCELPNCFGDNWKKIEFIQILNNPMLKNKDGIIQSLNAKFPELIKLS